MNAHRAAAALLVVAAFSLSGCAVFDPQSNLTLDDGFVINYIVMDFEGKDASVQSQLWAMQVVAGFWNDYEGEFPDR